MGGVSRNGSPLVIEDDVVMRREAPGVELEVSLERFLAQGSEVRPQAGGRGREHRARPPRQTRWRFLISRLRRRRYDRGDGSRPGTPANLAGRGQEGGTGD